MTPADMLPDPVVVIWRLTTSGERCEVHFAHRDRAAQFVGSLLAHGNAAWARVEPR